MSPSDPEPPENARAASDTSPETAADDSLEPVRRKLRALYRSIEDEPLPADLKAFAERLDRELQAKRRNGEG
jgi:hypothetical protein